MAGSSPVRKPSAAASAGSRRPNTLGLRLRDLEALLAELDAAGGPPEALARRLFERQAFRHTTIPMKIFSREGAPRAVIGVACRNLSRGGIAVLHSSYVHLGTRVLLALPHVSATRHVTVRGEVVRCEHFRGLVHDIGIRFEEEVDVEEVMDLHLR